MSQPLDYLINDKKQLLKCDWIKNDFFRFKINIINNSLTEALIKATGQNYRNTYNELEKFYEQISSHLMESSDLSAKQLYEKIFTDPSFIEYTRKTNIVLVKDPENKTDLRYLSFYFVEYPKTRFYFFPRTIRTLKANCNLLKYIVNIDITKPYNYFKVRIYEKKLYIDILENIKKIKENSNKELCDETVYLAKQKSILNNYVSFAKNLFSKKLKKDFKYYLYLYPKVFKINIIILIPFTENKIVVENIIEENENYPYLILFKPLLNKDLGINVELGAIFINRKRENLLDPIKHQNIIQIIKDRYLDKNNNLPIIEYLKNFQKQTKYLEKYSIDISSEDKDKVLENLKHYNYEFQKL